MFENEDPPNYSVLVKRVTYTAAGVSLPILIEGGFHYINVVILANKSLPASVLIHTMQGLIINTGCALLEQACTLVSNASGTHDNVKIKRILNAGILTSLIISVPTIMLALTSKPLFRAFKQPDDLLNSVEEYFAAFAPGIPAIFMAHLQKQIALGTSNIGPVNALSLFDNACITVLGYLLVSGKLGKELGVAGLGLASSITSWIGLIGLSFYLKYSARFQQYAFTFSEGYRDSLSELVELLKLGGPAGIQIGSELLIQLGLTSFIGRLGKNALSAYQISTQYILLTIVPTIGLNQAANILGGQANGANKKELANNIGHLCISLGSGVTLVLSGITVAAVKPLMRPFIDIHDPDNAEIISNASYLFIINGAAQIFDSVRIISAGAIAGVYKNTLASMGIELLTIGAIGLPLSYALGFKTSLGVLGVCIARGTGISLGSLSLLGYWFGRVKGWIHSRGEAFQLNELAAPRSNPAAAMDERRALLNGSDSSAYSSLPDGTRRGEQKSPAPLVFSRRPSLPQANIDAAQENPQPEQNRSFMRRSCVIL